MSQKNRRVRDIIFTINNYTHDIAETLKNLPCVFKAIGYEEGESKTPHIQGYIHFRNGVSFTAFNKRLGCEKGEVWANCELRKGTPEQAAGYCMKGNEDSRKGKKPGNEHYWEIGGTDSWTENGGYFDGDMPQQGHRSDLDEIAERIETGESKREIAMACPCQVIKYHRGIEALMGWREIARNFKPVVRVYWGKTGTGKTRRAVEESEGEYYKWQPGMGSWFDGYENQNTVIMDEYRGQLPIGELLSLIDRYDHRVQIKGGSREMNSKLMIFTSPKHPERWYEWKSDEQKDQLMRRIDQIVELGGMLRVDL